MKQSNVVDIKDKLYGQTSSDQANFKATLFNDSLKPELCREAILSFISSNLKYHEHRCFSLNERTGEKDIASSQIANELRQSQHDVLSLIKRAKEEGLQVKVRSSIEVYLGD